MLHSDTHIVNKIYYHPDGCQEESLLEIRQEIIRFQQIKCIKEMEL